MSEFGLSPILASALGSIDGVPLDLEPGFEFAPALLSALVSAVGRTMVLPSCYPAERGERPFVLSSPLIL